MKILKKLRDSFNLTQKELADKILIERSTLSQYEADKFPSFKIINNISSLFSVSIDYLIYEEKCVYPKNLNFISLSCKLDQQKNTDSINLLKKNVKSLIKNFDEINLNILQDTISYNLKDNFHENIKIIRNENNLMQKELAKKLNITPSVAGLYEKKSYPTVDKMIKLSEILNCSIHALVTGEKLSFDFIDKNFGKIILLADHLLTIEDKSFLIKLMKNIIDK